METMIDADNPGHFDGDDGDDGGGGDDDGGGGGGDDDLQRRRQQHQRSHPLGEVRAPSYSLHILRFFCFFLFLQLLL